MSFLDAYFDYHQIHLRVKDEEKTTFITEDDTFFYKRIPFGLKNARVTFQRLINKILKGLLERNMEA